MKVLFYSFRPYELPHLEGPESEAGTFVFTDKTLSVSTVQSAAGFNAISIFTADDASAPVLEQLHQAGVRFITIRATGFDNVDLKKAEELGIRVANVPAYSPYAIAEHAMALLLAVQRNLIIADRQVHSHNFTINALVGSELHGKTVGVIGTGTIGSIFAQILNGFGCKLLGNDIVENEALKNQLEIEYMSLHDLCRKADVISLHCSLNDATRHIMNKEMFNIMKRDAILINTGRGGCVNTNDIIDALTNKVISFYAADVYEFEPGIFFNDHSATGIQDALLEKLLSLPNVIITPHQGFATSRALQNIADTTKYNISTWASGGKSENELSC
jgi:D-lactate dehydrogenase